MLTISLSLFLRLVDDSPYARLLKKMPLNQLPNVSFLYVLFKLEVSQCDTNKPFGMQGTAFWTHTERDREKDHKTFFRRTLFWYNVNLSSFTQIRCFWESLVKLLCMHHPNGTTVILIHMCVWSGEALNANWMWRVCCYVLRIWKETISKREEEKYDCSG